jgi:ribosomal protein L37AE/L43A
MKASSRHLIARCPNCAAKLRINRLYAGYEVMCKHCRETFLAPASEPPADPSRSAPESLLAPESLGTPERVAVGCPTCRAVLSVRRVYCGQTVQCAQCQSDFIVAEPDGAKEPVSRSQDAQRARRRDRDAQDQLVLELDQRDAELAAALRERDSLVQELEQRAAQLDELVAERERVAEELQEQSLALAELEQLRREDQKRLLEICRERDELRNELVGLRGGYAFAMALEDEQSPAMASLVSIGSDENGLTFGDHPAGC